MFVRILIFVLPLILFSVSLAVGDEQNDCGLTKEEKLWDKLIRTQVKVESMLNEIRKTEEHVLAVLEYRKQEMGKILKETEENVETHIEQMKAELGNLERNRTATKHVGSSYVRWGRTTCPTDNELVYKGYAGGSRYTDIGGAANWLCLTDQPQWGYYEDNVASGAQVYGVEYQFGNANRGSSYFGKSMYDKDAPCSVCRPPRSSVIMIPGRLECFSGWKKEYSGYIVSGASGHSSASEFICLDIAAEMVAEGDSNTSGRLMYFAEATCGTLRCPPYVNGRELTCVVCSK